MKENIINYSEINFDGWLQIPATINELNLFFTTESVKGNNINETNDMQLKPEYQLTFEYDDYAEWLKFSAGDLVDFLIINSKKDVIKLRDYLNSLDLDKIKE